MDPVPAEVLRNPPYDGSVANLLTRTVDQFPDRVAVAHRDETLTYAEFGDRVRRIAGGLHEMGLEPDDRVVVHLPNGLAYCESIWACVHAGIVASPSNPQYRTRELEYQLDHSDARAVITSEAGAEYAVPVAEELGLAVIVVDGTDHPSLDDLAARGEPTLVERDDEDIMLQPYTSGTTGQPKGVLHTHRNYRVQLIQSITSYTAGPLRGDSLIVLPMFHLTGNNQMLSALTTGRTLRLLRADEWDPEEALDTMDEYDIPAFGGVATMFIDLLETYKEQPDRWDISTFVRAGQGGTKLPEPVHEEFEAVFEVSVTEGYGLTETTAATHTVASSTLGDKIGSVGQPVGHLRSKLVDPETGEEIEENGVQGELLVTGPQVMQGYYKNPEANEEAFTENGWFRTGDIAERDRDNYYYIKGREKDMILAGGYNVYPAEVEKVLYDHPDIHEAAVVGIPDERKGETVAAAVSLVEGAALTPDDVREYVLEELAPYKHPRVVEIVDELPKTGSGKIRKIDLQDRLTDVGEA